ncbi:MAG: hypothetical protein ACO24H_05090 [Polynucleobacter sp.]
MAFNFGAFAGGLAKGGLQTYQMLSEEEERELIKEERRRRLEKERAIEAVGRDTLGRAGTQSDLTESVQGAAGVGPQQAQAVQSKTGDAEFDRAVAQSAVDVMRENAARKGALPTGPSTVTAKEYTQEQAEKDYVRQLSAIDPRLGRQARIESFQINKLERDEKAQVKFGQAMERLDKDLATIESTLESKGMQGVYELAKKNGLNVKYIEPKNEGSLATVQLLGKDGKVEQIFTSASQAAQTLGEARMSRFVETEAMPLLGDVKSIIEAMNARRTAAREDRRVGLEQQRVDMEAKLLPERIGQMRAQIRESLSTATGKELDAAEKREYNGLRTELLKLLENPTAENAPRIQQLARRAAILNPKEVLVTKTERNPETGILESITTNVLTGEVQKSLSESNVPSAAVMNAAKSGKNPKTGQPYSQADIDAWNQKYPGTPWPGPQSSGKSAIPTR